MQRKSLLRVPWLAVAILGTVAGIMLRLSQLHNAFEVPSGLVTPGAPSTVMLLCGLAITAAVLAMLTAWQPIARDSKGRPVGADRALIDRDSMVFPVLMVIAAFIALMAAPLHLSQGAKLLSTALKLRQMGEVASNNGLLELATGVGAILTFIGLLQIARESLSPGRRGRSGYGGVLPAIGSCIWLMEHFRAFAPDPELWKYGPQLIAIAAAMFLYLDLASLASSVPHPRRAMWLAGMTVVISAIAVLGTPSAGDLILLCSQGIAALAVLWQLPGNLSQPLPTSTEPEPKEESSHE